jgi:hypothetical protein
MTKRNKKPSVVQGLTPAQTQLSMRLSGGTIAKRILSLANATLGVIKTASPSGQSDRPGPRPDARPSDQARDQAGGPAAVQPGDRYRRRTAIESVALVCNRGRDNASPGRLLHRLRPY